MIRIRGLCKAFGPHVALADVDADVAPGEIVAVVGPSGCGKSTLLRCMNGLETFDRGALDVAGFALTPGAAIRGRAAARLRSAVGMVFQELHLFPHLTALENVALAPRVVGREPRAAAHANAVTLLAHVGLRDRAGAYPSELSGGQKQRVALARALAQPLRVLLLDEPTSALDPEMRDEVRAVLRRVAQENAGLTIVIATHEMRLATELADRIWVMQAGRIVEQGTPAALLARPESDVAREFFASLGRIPS